MKQSAFYVLIFSVLTPIFTLLQAQNVTGKVLDSDAQPLPGVTVLVKNTTTGTVTNAYGQYSIPVSEPSAVLIFSFVGMNSQEVEVQGRNIINVEMQTDAVGLEDVVVIGYGAVKKTDLTGAISTVKTEELEGIPAHSIDGLLQGRTAGLQIINNSDDPGAPVTVRIRGSSSLNGSNSPLVVVDGFPLGDAGDLKQISPNDIESLEVLKDASASAIYGSRGANGVIIVTTKSGKVSDRMHVYIRNQTTVSAFTSKFDVWKDVVLMATITDEGRVNAGQPPLYVGATDPNGIYYPSIKELEDGSWPYYTDWTKEVFRNNPISENLTVGIEGGDEKTKYNFSTNYYNEKGAEKKNDYDRLNVALNLDKELFRNLTFRTNIRLSSENRNTNNWLSFTRNPIFPVYDEDGNYYLLNDADFYHPVALTNEQVNKTKSTDIITSGLLSWKVLPYLSINSQLNYKYGSSITDRYNPSKYTEDGTFNNGAAYIDNWTGWDIVNENYLTFDKEFNSIHQVNATVGFTMEDHGIRTSNLAGYDFVNESLGNENIGAGDPEKQRVSNSFSEFQLQSWLGRLNYSLLNKYLLTFTVRADGSSKFGENNKWGFFPSGAASWKAHHEDFVKNLDVFDQLKARISYGLSGNQGINPYQTLSRYGESIYYTDDGWKTGIGPGYISGWTGYYPIWSGIPNPDLKWETTSQFDAGLDMDFFKHRLRTTIDYYHKHTTDLLRKKNLPPSSGYDEIWVNDGVINNEGIELSLDGDIIAQKNCSFSASFIFSKNVNKLVSMGTATDAGLQTDDYGNTFEFVGGDIERFRQAPNVLAIGEPINVFYGYKVEGIIQSEQEGLESGLTGAEAQPGEFKYVDLNNDGVIDERDRTIIGDPNPDFIVSLNLMFSYKSFDIAIFLYGVFGNDVLDMDKFQTASTQPLRWTPDNRTNDYPSLRDTRQDLFSDWWIEDGSFVRIQNVNVGYNFKIPDFDYLSKGRFYVNISNLYTFSKFRGYDPEVGPDGIYWGGYPRLAKITLGLDLTF